MRIAKRSESKPVKPKQAKQSLAKAEAQALEKELLSFCQQAEQSLVEAAIRLDKFIRGRGWEPLGFQTMTAWREERMRFSEYFRLRHVLELLSAGVPEETIREMRKTNLDLMARQLPESKWKDPKLLEAAKGPVSDFQAFVKEKAAQAGTTQEDVFRRGFAGPKSLIEKWDLALKVAEVVDGAERLEDRVELIVSEYLNGTSEHQISTEIPASRMQVYERRHTEVKDAVQD